MVEIFLRKFSSRLLVEPRFLKKKNARIFFSPQHVGFSASAGHVSPREHFEIERG